MSSSQSRAPDPSVPQPLARRAAGGFGTSIAAGALLGGGSWLSDELGFPLGALLPVNLVGVWLAVAFVLGRSARSVPTGAFRGLIGLVAAVAAYYLLFATLGNEIRALAAGHAATIWGGVALVAGPVMGAAGAIRRHRVGWLRAIAVALLAAALIAEGLVFGGRRLLAFDPVVDPGSLLLAAELAIGAILPWLLLSRRERRQGYVATAVLGLAAAVSIEPVVTFIRTITDRF